MTPARFIQRRKDNWQELESLLLSLDSQPDITIPPRQFLRFAQLHRAACTDLSLANAWRLPREIQSYLEGLVSRGHTVLYSYPRRRLASIKEYFLRIVPRSVFGDAYVWICQLAFFVPFVFCIVLAMYSDDFVTAVLSPEDRDNIESMHCQDMSGVGTGQMFMGSGFYILNNASIDLQVFAMGILGGVGSLLSILFNAVYLGASLGYGFTSDCAVNLQLWIIGHAPFELFAIGLSGGAGLRIGYSVIAPGGRERLRALREEARNALPIITAAVTLTLIAAFIEGFLAPIRVGWLLYVKFATAIVCATFLVLYFGVLGFVQYRNHKQSGGRD